MKHMKRLLVLLLTVIAVSTTGLLTTDADAASTKEVEAQALSALGLFKGYDNTGTNFGLNDAATREQGLIFLIRMLGEEKAALAWTGPQPYSDVPASNFYYSYVGYAKAKGYTVGIGNNQFGISRGINMQEMTIFALRGLGYSDASSVGDFTYQNCLSFAKSKGILESDKVVTPFNRGVAVDILFGSMAANVKNQNYDLLSKLMNNGVVTQAQYDKAMAIINAATADLPDGTYTMKCMGNYIRVGSSGLELRDTSPKQTFTVINKSGYAYIKAEDGKYLSIGTIRDGAPLVTSTTPYAWIIQKQSSGAFTIRPQAKTSMVVNASEQKSTNGTQIIIWTHSGAPNNTLITFTPATTVTSVTSVKLDKTAISLPVGAKTQLTGSITPTSATNQNVTWSSSNTAVAKVDSNGYVTGVKAGTATITVKTVDGGKTATCKVTVVNDAVTTADFVMTNNTGKSITELYIVDASASEYGKDFLEENGYASWSSGKTITASFKFYQETKFDFFIRFSDGSEAEATGLSFAKATAAGGKINVGTSSVQLTVGSSTVSTVALTKKTTDLTTETTKLRTRYNAAVTRYNQQLAQLKKLGLDKKTSLVSALNGATAEINAMGKVIGEGTGTLTSDQIKMYTTTLDELDVLMNELDNLISAASGTDTTAASKALNTRFNTDRTRYNKLLEEIKKIPALINDPDFVSNINYISGYFTDMGKVIGEGTGVYTQAQIDQCNASLTELETLMNTLDAAVAEAKAPQSITVPVKIVNKMDGDIVRMRMSPSNANTWGNDLGTLQNGKSCVINVPFTQDALVWDLEVVDGAGTVITFTGIDFSECDQSGATLTLTYVNGTGYVKLG